MSADLKLRALARRVGSLAAQVVWKKPIWKEDWDGYQYGVNIIRMFEKERWILKSLLSSMGIRL